MESTSSFSNLFEAQHLRTYMLKMQHHGDVFVRPEGDMAPGLCRGVMDSGKTGYFRRGDTTPYIEVKTIISSPLNKQKQSKLSRKGKKSFCCDINHCK